MSTKIVLKKSLLIRAGFFIIVLIGLINNSIAFSTWWHAQATLLAFEKNRFSADARLLAQFANYLVDYHSAISAKVQEMQKVGLIGDYRVSKEDLERLHFDNLHSLKEIEYQWSRLETNTIRALKKFASEKSVRPGFRKIVLISIIGASLHAVQDFYAHSNWIDLLQNRNLGELPTWFELSQQERNSLNLYSGVYPDRDEPGVISHALLNKDHSGRKLHQHAYQTAVKASIEWVKKLINSVAFDWSGLFSFEVKSLPEKRWLRRSDATFLMATSVLADELDGPQPTVTVFNSDRQKAKVQAAAALSIVLSDYSASFLLVDNPYKLPTPNWCGFYLYHIEKELARGLLPLRAFKR